MYYLLIKSLHIVSMVAWFAGLFYLVRLFVYHREAFDMPKTEREILSRQYNIMEDRLHRIICQPAMILTWLTGLILIYVQGLEWFSINYWLHAKLTIVVLLSLYHFRNPYIIASLKLGKSRMDSFQYRLYNEVPTLILLSVVILAVYKNFSNFAYTFGGILLFGIVLYVFARVYKAQRSKT